MGKGDAPKRGAIDEQREFSDNERENRIVQAIDHLRGVESRHVHHADEEEADLEAAIDDLYAALTEAAVIWLEEKWGLDRACPYCEARDWVVSRPFNLLLESRETLAPHFSVLCTNCGHTVLMNAVVTGIIPVREGDLS